MKDTQPSLLDIFKAIAIEIHSVDDEPDNFTLILEADAQSINKIAARLAYLKRELSPWSMTEHRIYEARCYGLSILLRVKE